LFFPAFHVEPQFQAAGRTALLLTGLNMGLILPLGVFSAILVGLERFDILSGITVAGELTRAVLVFTFLKAGYGLISLAVIGLVITISVYSAIIISAKVLCRPLKVNLRLVNRTTLSELFGFGIHRFLWIVANQVIFYSDSLVIGYFLGAGSITVFAIAGSLINYGRNVVSLVTDTFYPAATRLDERQDLAGLRELLIAGTRVALLVAIPLCLGLIFLGKQFIILWMGKPYASSAVFLTVLAIPQLSAMSQYVSALVLAGMAKHRALAYLALAEGAANLALSIYLVRKIGLIGVAWGTVIPDLVCMTVIVPLYTLRILKMGVGEYVARAYVGPALCAIPTGITAYAFSRFIEDPSWPLFGGEVLIITGMFAMISYFVCLTDGERDSLREKVQRFFNRDVVVNET
jgi:O-antigen/teichoic acid export membrane protein